MVLIVEVNPADGVAGLAGSAKLDTAGPAMESVGGGSAGMLVGAEEDRLGGGCAEADAVIRLGDLDADWFAEVLLTASGSAFSLPLGWLEQASRRTALPVRRTASIVSLQLRYADAKRSTPLVYLVS